jgi:hypothetical protein
VAHYVETLSAEANDHVAVAVLNPIPVDVRASQDRYERVCGGGSGHHRYQLTGDIQVECQGTSHWPKKPAFTRLEHNINSANATLTSL